MDIKGFKVNFLGDSITEGTGVTDKANCRFDHRLAVQCQLSAVNNYGVGGTRLAHQIHPSEKPRYDLCFCGRVYDMDCGYAGTVPLQYIRARVFSASWHRGWSASDTSRSHRFCKK